MAKVDHVKLEINLKEILNKNLRILEEIKKIEATQSLSGEDKLEKLLKAINATEQK